MNEVYSVFGRHLDSFLYQRFKTKKNAAEHYKISAGFLSHISQGRKPIPSDLRKSLINDGFPEEYFAQLEGIKDIEAVSTFDEMKFLYYELKKNIQLKEDVIRILQQRIRELQGKSG